VIDVKEAQDEDGTVLLDSKMNSIGKVSMALPGRYRSGRRGSGQAADLL